MKAIFPDQWPDRLSPSAADHRALIRWATQYPTLNGEGDKIRALGAFADAWRFAIDVHDEPEPDYGHQIAPPLRITTGGSFELWTPFSLKVSGELKPTEAGSIYRIDPIRGPIPARRLVIE